MLRLISQIHSKFLFGRVRSLSATTSTSVGSFEVKKGVTLSGPNGIEANSTHSPGIQNEPKKIYKDKKLEKATVKVLSSKAGAIKKDVPSELTLRTDEFKEVCMSFLL
jgi:hypothetical protein